MDTQDGVLPDRGGGFAIALVIVGSILYSSKSLFVKHLMAIGAESGDILSVRMLWALPVYSAVILWNLRTRPAAVADLLRMAALGLCGFWVAPRLNFLGLGRTSAGLERILIQASTAFVVLFVALRVRRIPRPIVLVSVALSYAGMVLAMTGRDEGRSFADPVGAAFIVGASVAWSIFVVGVGPLQKRLGVALSTSVGMAAGTLPALTETIIHGHGGILLAPPPSWVAALAGLVVLGTVAPSFVAQAGLSRLGPVRSSILSLTGPALLPLFAMATLGESMPWQQVAGLAVVLATCAAMTLRSG